MSQPLKKSFELFLKKNKFLPISLWQNFKIKHGKENKFYEEIIKKKVGNINGLYIYKKNSRVIYIGKAKPLFGRLKSHYQESFKEVSGDTKWKTWHKFFSLKKNIGLIKIFWKEVSEEPERQILEKMLDYVLNPEFKSFRKEVEVRGKKFKPSHANRFQP